MDFFNKLGGLAKNVTDKTNDLLEIGKLNSRIHAEEDAIEQHKFDLGEYMWEKFETGVAMDERATVICLAIRERQGNIQAMQAEIEQIKRAQEELRSAQAEARQQAREQARQAKAAAAAAGTELCPVCGGEVKAGSKFCGDCGTQLH